MIEPPRVVIVACKPKPHYRVWICFDDGLEGEVDLSDLEGVYKVWVRRFCGLFWPLFNSKMGAHIDKSILAPIFELKIGSKEPQNRQNHTS